MLGERELSITLVVFLARYAPVVCSNPGTGWSPPISTSKQDKRGYGPAVTFVESVRLYNPVAASAAEGDLAVTPYSTVKQVKLLSAQVPPTELYGPANVPDLFRGSYQQAVLPNSPAPKERNKREFGSGSMLLGESW